MSDAPDQIRELLATYERSLNTGDAALAAALYTADGVFMPAGLPTATGPAALLASYQAIFATIRLNVSFTVDELVVTGDTTAYALTRSEGRQTVLATGTQTPEANREVFVFHGGDAGWRIARYLFNKAA